MSCYTGLSYASVLRTASTWKGLTLLPRSLHPPLRLFSVNRHAGGSIIQLNAGDTTRVPKITVLNSDNQQRCMRHSTSIQQHSVRHRH